MLGKKGKFGRWITLVDPNLWLMNIFYTGHQVSNTGVSKCYIRPVGRFRVSISWFRPIKQILYTTPWWSSILVGEEVSHYLVPVLYSLTETETEMFCKTQTKYKRKSESIKRNSNWNKIDFTTKMITQNVVKNLAYHCFHLVIWWQLTTFAYDTTH